MQARSRQAPLLHGGGQGSRTLGVRGKKPEAEDLGDELCSAIWLGAPVAKQPANTPTSMCVVVGKGTVWVLDKHSLLLKAAGGRMRIAKVNSCHSSGLSVFLGSGTGLGTEEQATQTAQALLLGSSATTQHWVELRGCRKALRT